MRPSARLKAAVFDMDGTLLDNMRYHNRAWLEMVRRLGVSATEEQFERHFAGKKNEEIFPELLGRPVEGEELARLADEKESLYRELYRPHLAPLRGARELLERLRASGLRLAVATAAPPGNRTFALDGLMLRPLFEHVVGAEDVKRGKPFPDIFLAAARALGVEPEACVAFEDAIQGVRAARAAGMLAVGVTTTTPAELLKEAGAQWTLTDFSRLPAELEALL
jgi:beta-phosphoglucomutase